MKGLGDVSRCNSGGIASYQNRSWTCESLYAATHPLAQMPRALVYPRYIFWPPTPASPIRSDRQDRLPSVIPGQLTDGLAHQDLVHIPRCLVADNRAQAGLDRSQAWLLDEYYQGVVTGWNLRYGHKTYRLDPNPGALS